MSQVKVKSASRKPAKDKSQKEYYLPTKLVRRIALMAVNEHCRPSHVVERLLLKGLDAEAREASARSASRRLNPGA